MKIWKSASLLAVLVVIDQITKIIAKQLLEGKQAFQIIKDVFCFQYLEGGNTGAAFGLFHNQTEMLAIISLVLSIIIIFFIIRLPRTKYFIPLNLSLIFLGAGAIGNLIDRLFRKYVIDFIYFKAIDFPIFNVADCYVTISAIVLCLLFLFYYKDEDFAKMKRKE